MALKKFHLWSQKSKFCMAFDLCLKWTALERDVHDRFVFSCRLGLFSWRLGFDLIFKTMFWNFCLKFMQILSVFSRIECEFFFPPIVGEWVLFVGHVEIWGSFWRYIYFNFIFSKVFCSSRNWLSFNVEHFNPSKILKFEHVEFFFIIFQNKNICPFLSFWRVNEK